MRARLRRWLALAMLVSGGAIIGLGVLWRRLPDPRPLRDPAWVKQRFDLAEWTPLAALPPTALRAILLSEDDIYFQHDGLRLDEVPSAVWTDLQHLRYRRGASSITQQVVRNAFLDRDKSLGRKAAEALLARKADRLVDKRSLLEDYLNLAEWGSHGERGIAFAARERFGKAPAALDAAEAALLSWLLPQPRQRGRHLGRDGIPARAQRHVRRLLERLVREGALSAEEAKAQSQALFAAQASPHSRPSLPSGPLSLP